MSWAAYRDAHLRSQEEAEREHDRLWEAVLALLLLREGRLRRRIARAALRVDLTDRAQVRRFRSFVRLEVERTENVMLRSIVGRATDASLDPAAGAGPARGQQGAAVRRAAAIAEEGRQAAARVLDQDLRRVLDTAPVGPEATRALTDRLRKDRPSLDPDAREAVRREINRLPEGDPVRVRLEKLRDLQDQHDLEVERWKALQRETARRRREGEDVEDLLLEADDNPVRNIRNEMARVTEQIIGLSSPYTRRGSARDVVAYMLGSDDARTNDEEEGWRLNRSVMRSSVAAHVRAMHRRRTVAEAFAQGIQHFRLDVPRKRLDRAEGRARIRPDGLLGQQLWRVRTLEEWQDVQRRANQGRIASSAWDTLGLGHEDVSYITPVPRIYLEEATEEGRRWRERWLSRPARGRAA